MVITHRLWNAPTRVWHFVIPDDHLGMGTARYIHVGERPPIITIQTFLKKQSDKKNLL